MIQRIAMMQIAKKESTRILRIWSQTLVPPIITTALYFLIFGSLLGSRISNINGIPYINFIVPGLIMMAVLTNAYTNVSGSFFSAKFQRSLEELLVSPASTNTIIWGYVFGGIFRSVCVGTIVSFVALFFTKITIFNFGVVISVALLTSILFSLMGLLNGILAKKFDDVAIVPTFIITPLTYLGGVFYSVSFLPPFWKNVTLANPIFYIINSFRYGFLGISDITISISYIMLFVFTVALYIACYILISKGAGLKS